jgi:hypothetical protein
MSISVSISVGYERRRPDVRGDRWEGRMDSLGLLLIGSVVVLALVFLVVPRILAWLATL